ncbi:response regulator [Nibribacter ruber]|uniref:Response regulator n=1 Tax=Nibribacter ruber TaxID=2698458 RepID=A0A6P1P147_9BACT|nr:response regulator [Nibribacter ruber]QHL86862.1 response regulator [Nibribacter ruber]
MPLQNSLLPHPLEIGEILVIDDDASSLYLIKDLLTTMGLGDKVTTTNNVPDALHILSQRAGTEKFPELVLLDIRMPESDGFDFLEKLETLPLQANAAPKVVVLSYYGNRDYQNRAADLGVAAYLRKPLTREKVLDIINLN